VAAAGGPPTPATTAHPLAMNTLNLSTKSDNSMTPWQKKRSPM
jgi:hypothetical protein